VELSQNWCNVFSSASLCESISGKDRHDEKEKSNVSLIEQLSDRNIVNRHANTDKIQKSN